MVKLSLFSLEELSSFLLLLSFPNQTLRSELHLRSQGSDLFLEFKSCSCKLDFHILNLRLLLRYLHLKVFPQFVVFLKQSIELLPVCLLALSESGDFGVQPRHFAFVEILKRLYVSPVQLGHLDLKQLDFFLPTALLLAERRPQTVDYCLELGSLGVCTFLHSFHSLIKSLNLLAFLNTEGDKLLFLSEE